MSRCINSVGYGERLKAEASKPIPENYRQNIYYRKGNLIGVLAVYDNAFVWEVFADPDYSQHLDWNKPECKCLNGLEKPNFFQIDNCLKENGFVFLRQSEYEE